MGSLVARVRRAWPCLELQALSQQGHVSRLLPSLAALVSREKLPPFPLCSHTPSIAPPFPQAHTPVFSCQLWNKLSSSGVCISSCRAQHEVFRTQALKFSSAASPVSEKDGNADSHVEETCVSGDEKGEPLSEAKDGPAPEVDKEQAAKAEQEDKEALLNSIAQLEAFLSEKNSQLIELKERAETTKAELASVRTRAQREADNTKKYAVQEFVKSLLDVADNLGRALTTIPANVRKELLTDQSETGKLLRSLVEGLILTERELMKVLKKFGVEKFEPVGQQFDPNSHLALFEVADPSKEAGTVALVAKVGYMLHDRVVRPAEVGVVKSLE